MANSSRGWVVTLAGTGINLALGVLYAWSVFAKALTEQWNWSKTQSSLPYTLAILVFALMMIPAGRWQDKAGPRIVATVGGILTGSGLILASFFDSVMGITISFGLLAGAGIGLGYAAATPAAVKWFPPEKKGLITGIVVSGFGLASVYIAPLTNYLLKVYGINDSFRILGIAFLLVATLLAQLLTNPPADYKAPVASPAGKPQNTAPAVNDYSWQEMLKTRQFYLLWLMFACGSLAGLMIIGHLSKIAKVQLNIQWGFALVALLAIFNAGGRIIAGILSDVIGRTRTMLLVFVLQAIVMSLFAKLNTLSLLAAGAALVGFNYGACLSLFPSATADYFGTRNLGLNYGIVFTAWGVGGMVGPLLAGWVADTTGTYTYAYYIAALLCVLAAGLSLVTRAPRSVALLGQEEKHVA
ncbi:OFA family MFS transporter [Carboxydocella sp. ULO1]|uniref:L-lactate MFS transporter n=1 Tax=Carboxydocella sp. ULO1 TaxID=1926599 RepID=UPI0009AD2B92|nr:OFA family MFS transporter [Carboxydocella sp. ULO1]GAW30199.1 oxalate:formate antiporter [Carboxydocella sp. ULO1]